MKTGPKRKDYTTKVFGRLTVLKEGTQIGKQRKWVCRCTCGTIKEIYQTVLNQGALSCGCLQKEKSTTHGESRIKSKLYRVWINIRSRCTNENHEHYSSYGGRGITWCTEWDDYPTFKQWAISNGYKEGLYIDRRDNDGNYSPDNCRWVTSTTQQRNRRGKKNSTSKYTGVSYTPRLTKNPWIASIKHDGKKVVIGYYSSEIFAARQRDKYIKDKNLTDFILNFKVLS